MVALTRAVAADSNFALAYYRLSVAAEWNFEFSSTRAYARRALELSRRLPLQQQPLISPWLAFLEGRYRDAENRYNTILTNHPDDVEARAFLAEVLVHFNPIRGIPADSAGPMFDRVLAELPEYSEARFHALEFAARARDPVRFDSLAAGLNAANPQRPAWDAVRAFTWGSAADQQRVLSALDKANEYTIGIAAGRVAAHTHNFPAARLIAQKLAGSERTEEWRAGALVLSAELALAANDWPAAQRELARAELWEEDWPRQLTALYLLHPLVNAPRDRLLQEIQRLRAWRPEDHEPSTSFFFGAHALVRPELRLYLLGLLNAAVGDTAQAEAFRRQLASTPPNEVREPDVAALASALAQSVRAHIARARGQDSIALHLLLQAGADINAPPEFLVLSPFYARAYDRFTIASLSHKLGQPQEAIRWYQSLLDSYDFVYAAAAHEQLAHVYAQLGDRAREQYHGSEFARITR